jgi:hypothetical protein
MLQREGEHGKGLAFKMKVPNFGAIFHFEVVATREMMKY